MKDLYFWQLTNLVFASTSTTSSSDASKTKKQKNKKTKQKEEKADSQGKRFSIKIELTNLTTF